jgi:hypothetical protein
MPERSNKRSWFRFSDCGAEGEFGVYFFLETDFGPKITSKIAIFRQFMQKIGWETNKYVKLAALFLKNHFFEYFLTFLELD